MEGVNLYLFCTRVFISLFKSTTKIYAPFRCDLQIFTKNICDLQMPLSRIQIVECTTYEFKSLKPLLCWIQNVCYFVASNFECIPSILYTSMYNVIDTDNTNCTHVYIWIAKAMHCLDFKLLTLWTIMWNNTIHMLIFDIVWVFDTYTPMFLHTIIADFMIMSRFLIAIYILI